MIKFNVTLFASAFICELLGIGLITKYYANDMYHMIAATNNELFFVLLYAFFFIIYPICSTISLHRARYYLLDRDKTDRMLIR